MILASSERLRAPDWLRQRCELPPVCRLASEQRLFPPGLQYGRGLGDVDHLAARAVEQDLVPGRLLPGRPGNRHLAEIGRQPS